MLIKRHTGALRETLSDTRGVLVTEEGKSPRAVSTDEVKPRHRKSAESTSLNSWQSEP